MSKILKTEEGIFIPREVIEDFERVEVDESMPGVIVIRSMSRERNLDSVLARIDSRREMILKRRGLLGDSASIIREGRELEMR